MIYQVLQTEYQAAHSHQPGSYIICVQVPVQVTFYGHTQVLYLWKLKLPIKVNGVYSSLRIKILTYVVGCYYLPKTTKPAISWSIPQLTATLLRTEICTGTGRLANRERENAAASDKRQADKLTILWLTLAPFFLYCL